MIKKDKNEKAELEEGGGEKPAPIQVDTTLKAPSVSARKLLPLKSFFRSISFKLFLQNVVMVVLFSVFVVLIMQFFLASYQNTRTQNEVEQNFRQICNQLALFENAHSRNESEQTDNPDPEYEALNAAIMGISENSSRKIFILKNDEEFLATDNFSSLESIREMKKITEGKTTEGVFYSASTDLSTFLIYKGSFSTENTAYDIEIHENLAILVRLTQSVNTLIRNIVILGTFVALIWSLWYSRLFTSPIRQMSMVTKKMAQLDFSAKCYVSTTEELGELATGINEMSDRLEDALAELKEKNERLTKELEKAHKLDEMRKKFVSDVSHELKTPLAIISGYAESIKMSSDKGVVSEKTGRYSEAIMEESAKMNHLVLDLMNLSQYESGNYVLNKTEFNIAELCESVLAKHEKILSENDAKVDLSLEYCQVTADSRRIEQVLANYLSNAVTHLSGEKKIALKGNSTSSGYRLSVFNTGEHITSQDLSQIWTAFYRADTSRKRSEGHYGIGLSIVKALIELHGGECGVENVEGGVEFYFII